MTAKVYSVRLPEKLIAQVREFAREAGVKDAAAIRLLIQRSLGRGVPRLLVEEKVLETRLLVNKRFGAVFDNLRDELHMAVDELTATTTPPQAVEEEEEEPVAPVLTGRRPKKGRR